LTVVFGYSYGSFLHQFVLSYFIILHHLASVAVLGFSYMYGVKG